MVWEKLVNGDPEGFLSFNDETKRLYSDYGAGPHMSPGYEWGDLNAIRTTVDKLQQRDTDYYEKKPGAEPLTNAEIKYLDRKIALAKTVKDEQKEVKAACGPIKIFIIDDHIDTDLVAAVRKFSIDSTIPIYEQIHRTLKIIAEKCLVEAANTRAALYNKFDMGLASTPAQVVIAMNNFGIIKQQMETHYDTVTSTVDQVKTTLARRHNPDSADVIKTCPAVLTREELVTMLRKVIDPSSSTNSVILCEFNRVRNNSWDTIVTTITDC